MNFFVKILANITFFFLTGEGDMNFFCVQEGGGDKKNGRK